MKILIEESVLRKAVATLEQEVGIGEEITALRSALDAAEKVEPNADLLMTLFERYAAQRIMAYDHGNKFGDVNASDATWVQFRSLVYTAPAVPEETK